MEPHHWKAVNEIFHAALELPPSQRLGFVSVAAKGNTSLQSEVNRLLEADWQAGSYLESPLLPLDRFLGLDPSPPPFQPGDVLKNRFRVLRVVGEGGMGHVFEAADTELNVRVALKAIRPEIAGNPKALDYFRREVLTARTITHPNVCRTYDLDRGFLNSQIGASKEFFFLTMEFLDGETLAVRLKRSGALHPDEALNIARQISAALDAAHDAGIIHRDIKPANIMLVASSQPSGMLPRVVITDFGLARRDPLYTTAELSSFSQTGAIGTLAYMAPEQLEAGAAVSAATDVYAFGLVLFEMVTGQRAFPCANLLSGIAQRLAGPPPSPRAVNPQLPQVWETAILGCLRLIPSQRFQTAGRVVEALCGASPALPPVPAPIHSQADRTKPQWHKWSAIAPAFLMLVALFGLWFRLHRQEIDAKVVPGALVYLTQVENRTHDRSFDNLTELLYASLGQSARINLLDQSRVGDTLQLMTKPPDTLIDPPTAREIAMRTGAVRVIFATVTGSGESCQLNVDIQQPDNEPMQFRNHWPRNFAWKTSNPGPSSSGIPTELLGAVRNAADWIRHEVGESVNDIVRLDAPPEDVTTSSWEALASFEQAEELSRARHKEDAVVALQNAVAIDPGFALAYGRLGDIEVSLGRSSDAYRAYEKALEAGVNRRLARRELDRIRGIYASDSWDYSTAEKAFRDYTVFYPNDFRGWFYRALPLMQLGRFAEAEATLQHVEEILPGNIYSPFDLGLNALEHGRIDQAKHWLEALRDRGDGDGSHQLAGTIAVFAGDSKGAIPEFQAMEDSANGLSRLRGFSFAARAKAEVGDPVGALQEIHAGLAEASAQGNLAPKSHLSVDQASILCDQKDWAACAESIRAAIQIDNSPDMLLEADEVLGNAIQTAPAQFRNNLVLVLNRVLARVPTESNNRADEVARIRLQAEQQAAAGRIDAALAEARHSVSIDQQYRRHEQLVRFLLTAAARTNNAGRRSALLAEAQRALAVPAKGPAAVWLQPESYRPGAWRMDLHAYTSAELQRYLTRSP